MDFTTRMPWDRKKWRDGVIRPAKPAASWFLLGFAALWVVLGLACLKSARFSSGEWNGDATRLLVFVGIGVLLAIPGVIGTIRWAKWRGVRFGMAAVPGVIGGTLKGDLMVPGFIGDATEVKVKILNEQLTTKGSGKHQHVDVAVIYQDELVRKTSMLSMQSGCFVIPLEFTIPFDTIDATSSQGRTRYQWRMLITSKTPGLDMKVSMELPVFKTERSNPAAKRK
jgi:hypothetical protein